jgi:hypothetical protein
MTDVLPEWLVKVTSPATYDRHTAITATCAHGNHARCGSLHRIHGGHHTTIVGRDGYPMQWPGGPLVSVHLTTDECIGCHCACHTSNVQLMMEAGDA